MGLKSFIFGLKHQFFYGVFPPPLQHFWLNYTNVAKTKQSKFVYWLFYTIIFFLFFFSWLFYTIYTKNSDE